MKANQIIKFAVSIFIDVVVAAIIGVIFRDISYFALSLCALIFIPIVVAVYSLLKVSIIYILYEKSYITGNYIKILKSQKFPNPNGEFDMEDYASRIVNEKTDDVVLAQSMFILNEFSSLKSSGKYISFVLFSMAASNALKEYDHSFVKYE